MKIKDIMTDEVICIGPETTVIEAAQLMQKHDVGSIPVCNNEGIMGIITDRDIIVRNIAHGHDPKSTKVQDIMTNRVEVVSPETKIEDAAELMSIKQIRRLPVAENNKLVGMVSLGDLSLQGISDMEVGQTLADISFPSQPEKMKHQD